MTTSSDDTSILLSSFLTPTKGLHTTSTTRLALHHGDRSRSSCTLHLYFTLPTQLIADPYELAHRRESYRFERFGGGNLEAPVFSPGAGADAPAGLLLDLTIPGGEGVEGEDSSTRSSVIQIDVPLHARYGVPKTGGELIDEVALPPPEAFWACPTTSGRNVEGAPGIFILGFFFFASFCHCWRISRILTPTTILFPTYVQQNTCEYPMRYAKSSSSHLRWSVAARGRSS